MPCIFFELNELKYNIDKKQIIVANKLDVCQDETKLNELKEVAKKADECGCGCEHDHEEKKTTKKTTTAKKTSGTTKAKTTAKTKKEEIVEEVVETEAAEVEEVEATEENQGESK